MARFTYSPIELTNCCRSENDNRRLTSFLPTLCCVYSMQTRNLSMDLDRKMTNSMLREALEEIEGMMKYGRDSVLDDN